MSDTVEEEDFEPDRTQFYALIGHCVTRYQAMEDYLPELFAAALGGDAVKAAAIFDVVRGLEPKLDMISAGLSGADERHQRRWKQLLACIADAAKKRNEIAHARPTHNAGLIRVILSQDSSISPEITQAEKARMELRKRTRGGEKVWTTEDMRAEYQRVDKLFGNLIAFVKELGGDEVPSHLST
jgi:hypothetical protein